LTGPATVEHERLAGLEALFDSPTRAILERIGVRRGWSVAAVGAGRGSIARWLADRVGVDGEVLAVDSDVSLLDGLDRRNARVERLDVLTQALPAGNFDLVYSRFVMAGAAPPAIDNMLPGLRRGGTLLAIAVDWPEDGAAWPPSEADVRVTAGIRALLTEAGCDTRLGRKLPSLLRRAGLAHIQAEPIQRVFQGGSELTAMYRHTTEKLRADLLARGHADEGDLAEWHARLDDPGVTFLGPPLVAAWGRACPPEPSVRS